MTSDWPLPAAEIEDAEQVGLMVRPECTCIPGPNGQTDTDGCVLHDLIVSGLLIGEEN